MHVSNLYHMQPQAELARELCRHSFADRVFFCNSGAEANEAAIKLARRYGQEKLGGKYEIISTHNSFHGRTLATLTATGQEKVRAGYDPLPAGFRQVPYNDLDAMEAAIDEQKTVAILIEPIQAEGGVIRAQRDLYVAACARSAISGGILLIFDEVQTGMGRTGKLFGYEHFGVKPDIMTLAKALGGGLPLGAMLAREEVASSFVAGQSCVDVRRQSGLLRRRVGGDATLLKRRRAQELRADGQIFRQRSRSVEKAFSVYPRDSRQGAAHRRRA